MEYPILINAGAYVVVLYTLVFGVNPLLGGALGHDYEDSVFFVLMLELKVVGCCALFALVLASFFHVFGG